jgi:hypothetical protein
MEACAIENSKTEANLKEGASLFKRKQALLHSGHSRMERRKRFAKYIEISDYIDFARAICNDMKRFALALAFQAKESGAINGSDRKFALVFAMRPMAWPRLAYCWPFVVREHYWPAGRPAVL